MKKLVLVVLLMQTTFLGAEKPVVNPADFTITVHVVYSHYVLYPPGPAAGYVGYQKLDAVINGQQVELRGEEGLGVLTPGDYKAQLTKDKFVPGNPNGYDMFVVYKFLLPGGAIRNFDVVGLGPAAANP